MAAYKKQTQNTNTPLDDAKITQLRSTHELWKGLSDQWAFYVKAYEGGSDFACRENLFKHLRENALDYDDRVKRLHNTNYCDQLVDFYTNFIFAESIDRDGGDSQDFYENFVKNVNRRGDSVDEFMRRVSDDQQIFGMSYVMVDAPVVDETVITQQDIKDKNIVPYWVLIKADEIVDWIVDDFGVYSYLKRRQCIYRAESDGKHKYERYTIWTPTDISIQEVDVTVEEKPILLAKTTQVNPVGEVPVGVALYKRSKQYPEIGLSFLRDFAYNNREINNLTSLLQEFLYRQAFNILTMEDDGGIPTQSTGDDVIGTSNLLLHPKGATAPKYITPPSDPAMFIQGERERIKQSMFSRAAQDSLNELFNGEKSSGFSQAQSFSKTVPFISSRADSLEQLENRLMTLTMKWAKKTWNGKIKYKDRYELTNLSDALTQFQILARDLQIPSPTWIKSELKRLVHEYDGKLPVEDVALINKEIDEMSFDGWMETQKEALIGQNKPSAGEQQKPKGTGTMVEVAQESNNTPASTNKLKK